MPRSRQLATAQHRTIVRCTIVQGMVVVSGMVVALTACSRNATPSTGSLPSSSAHVRIVSPNNGDVTGPNVHVTVELDGGRLLPLTSTKLVPNGGHLHILVDGQPQSMQAGAESDVSGLAPGRHIITAEFVNARHQPWRTPVTHTIVIQTQ